MHFSLSLCLAPHGLLHTIVHQSISCYKYLYFHSRCCQMHFSARMMRAQTSRIKRYRQVSSVSCRNEAAPRRVRFIFQRECVGGEISTRKHNNMQRVEAQKEARTEKTETK
ncbi:unnamed protein product [Trichogramma brassicae]|uniref:Uncharacterized protein n=1 Tax=Trichogramma brassicae TaxID=86971 RepID=A0A6H5IP56_9HYME|nr:unnamed protein product [Trichogramma brassicae]